MDVQFFNPGGKQLIFQKTDSKKYRGVLLPGCEIQQSHSRPAIITVQELTGGLVNIGYRLLEIFSKIRFFIRESNGLRLEALLSGETYITVNGDKRKFRAGEYRITDEPFFKALFKKNTHCSIFISWYPADLLKQLEAPVAPCTPTRMPDRMMHLINEMLQNTYNEGLLNFYYENCMRDLLFFHLANHSSSLSGDLTDKDVELIYKTDAFIASNLPGHHTIETLAKLMNTNAMKLKLGFKRVYGMGVFERLAFRRMEQAKLLLETTDKQIKEIAPIAGYSSTAAFINAFRKKFGITPREWRAREHNFKADEDE